MGKGVANISDAVALLLELHQLLSRYNGHDGDLYHNLMVKRRLQDVACIKSSLPANDVVATFPPQLAQGAFPHLIVTCFRASACDSTVNTSRGCSYSVDLSQLSYKNS